MAGGGTATFPLWAYRRRLAAAAAASLALHLLLARGLALTSLGFDGNLPGAAAAPRKRPVPRADFIIRVPNSPRVKPAHERPLAIATAPAAAGSAPAPRPATGAALPPDPAEASAGATARGATAPPPARDLALAAAPAPDRAATAESPPPPATAVDAAATDAAALADVAPSPAPASRDRAADPAVASRWRPREVALLERLAAPAIPRTMAVPDDRGDAPPGPAVRSARAPVAATAGSATAATVAGPTGQEDEAVAVGPADPAPAPATGRASIRPGRAAASGDRLVPMPSGVAAGTTAARGIGTGGARERAADEAARGVGSRAARTPDRAPVAQAVDGGGDGPVPEAAPATGTAVEPGPAPGPRSVGLAAGPAGGPARAAAAVPRRDDPAVDDVERDGAQLSVPRLPSPVVGAVRSDDAPTAADARPPERAVVVVLPAETRVRDVAEAFARRGRDARPDRRNNPRALRADAIVDRGLAFLARAQQADGRWSLGRFAGSRPADVPQLSSDTAATGLALLTFLGAGHDHFDGPHRDTVRRGLEFLLSAQKPDGDLFRPADDLSNRCAWLYSHGIASIALCEAVGMTGDPLLRPAATRACGFIATSQHPTLGGWRYAPRSDADLSVSGWMLVALRSGALAGLEVDPRAFAGVRTLLGAAEAPDDLTRYAYNPRQPDERGSELSGLCMTAVGALMRLHTGAPSDDPRIAAAARALAARRPAFDARSRDAYLWYYASQVLVNTGGPEWDAWYAALVDTLADTQETAGGRSGSWDPLGTPPDRWGRYGGRIYVTALHLLALEVPDRRLPTLTAGE